MVGYLQSGPNRAIVSIGDVDTANRLCSGTFADGSECGNIVNARNHVGAVQVTPAVGEQWVVEMQGTQWMLISKLPIHTPDLDGTTTCTPGQVQLGSSGPMELFGSAINMHATINAQDINAANITIPEGNQLILNGTRFRMHDGVLQVSTDGVTWADFQPPPPDIPASTDDLPEGTTNKYFTTARASAAAPVQHVAGRTGDVVLTPTDVSLGNVANLAPADLPVSTATSTALTGKADLVSGLVPVVQVPDLPTTKITGLDTTLTSTTGGLQSIFNAFKGGSGGSITDLLAAIANLAPSGLFNAAGLSNTANLPVLNQDRVTGLPSLASLVTDPTNGLQSILNAFKGGSGGLVSDLSSRIQNLTTGGLFNAASLNNTANLPVLNQDRVSGLPGFISGLLSAPSTLIGALSDTNVPGIGTLLDNLFGGINRTSTTGHTHDEVLDSITSQNEAVVGNAAQLSQVVAAFGDGTQDADDFERATLGSNWRVITSNGGSAVTNGHDLVMSHTDTTEYILLKTDKTATGNFQTSEIVLGTAPGFGTILVDSAYGHNDVWLRCTNFTTWATRTGVRCRWTANNKTIRLSAWVNGTEVVTLYNAAVTNAVAGSRMLLETGVSGVSRRFVVRINGSIIPSGDVVESGTASQVGSSNLWRGLGGRTEHLGIDPFSISPDPGTVKNWMATG